MDEILNARSAVPAVSSRKRLSDFAPASKPKKAKISRKDLDRLRSIAYGGDATEKDVVQTGDIADHDPWAVQEPKKDTKYDFLEEKKPIKEPETLKHAPVSLAKSGKAIPAVRKPEGGKSYNPHFVEWANLIEREGAKEVEAEKKRLREAEEEAARIERILAAQAEPEPESDGNESTWESEWEGFSDEENKGKKKRPERKTPAQRNRIKRRKEEERREKHEAKMKEKLRQAERIKEIAKAVEEKEKARQEAALVAKIVNADETDEEAEEVLRKKRFGKAQYVYPSVLASSSVFVWSSRADQLTHCQHPRSPPRSRPRRRTPGLPPQAQARGQPAHRSLPQHGRARQGRVAETDFACEEAQDHCYREVVVQGLEAGGPEIRSFGRRRCVDYLGVSKGRLGLGSLAYQNFMIPLSLVNWLMELWL